MTTTNLGMTFPTVGADSDVWGNELNTMFNTLDAHLAGAIYGLTLSTAGSTATFGIAAGSASGMSLASAYTKTTSAWAVGIGTGALDTGAVANSTWYHVWLIQRSDTLVVDVLVSTSATSPTMPANYDRKRRIGAMKTDGSAQWVKFSQLGNEFHLGTPVLEISAATLPITPALITLSAVPPGVKVRAKLRGSISGSTDLILLSSPEETSHTAFTPNGNITASYGAGSVAATGFTTEIYSNTNAQIYNSSFSAVGSVNLVTFGWTDRRGQG